MLKILSFGLKRTRAEPPYPEQAYPEEAYPDQAYADHGYPDPGYPEQPYPDQHYLEHPQPYPAPTEPYPSPAEPYPQQWHNGEHPGTALAPMEGNFEEPLDAEGWATIVRS